MNTHQQAYIEGFIKRANEYGYNENQAIELLKLSSSMGYEGLDDSGELTDEEGVLAALKRNVGTIGGAGAGALGGGAAGLVAGALVDGPVGKPLLNVAPKNRAAALKRYKIRQRMRERSPHYDPHKGARRGFLGGSLVGGLAGGALAAGTGALGLSKLMKDPADNNELAKTATSFGATRNLLRQLASEGIKVTRDPKTFLSLEKGRGAASLLSKDSAKARAKVDPAKFIPKPAQKGGTGTMYVGKDLKNHPALQEDIKNFKDYTPSPREALFHEAGHGMHHLEDPEAFLNIAGTHAENMANELARERIANNNAINFMQSNNTPSSLIAQYKKNLGVPFRAYSDYAKNVAVSTPDYKGKALHNPAHFSVEKQGSENPKATNLLLQKRATDYGLTTAEALALVKTSAPVGQIIEKVRNFLNPNRANPLYGKAVADRIRRHGSVYMAPHFESSGAINQLSKKLLASANPHIKRLGERLSKMTPDEEEIAGTEMLQHIKDSNKFVIPTVPKTKADSPVPAPSTHTVSQKVKDELARIGPDKVQEAKEFKGIGKTDSLDSLFAARKKDETVKQLLDRVYGDKGWVAKQNEGASTISTRGSENPSIYFSKDSNAHGIDKIPNWQHGDWLIQPNKDLAEVSPLTKLVDRFYGKKHNRNMSKMKEYRVHVINGQVVPYATIHRGSFTRATIDPIMPWRSREIRNVENYAQEQLNALKNKHLRQGNYGFDVAIDKAGKPQLIETNPAEPGGASGFLNSPLTQDAITAAATGKLPIHVQARRALYGAGALGLGALGLNHTHKNKEESTTA